MKREDVLRRVGNIKQLADITARIEADGAAKGERIFSLNNNLLRFDVLGDHCLDLHSMSYRGQNVSFVSKPGLVNKSSLDKEVRSLAGGMVFTCGLRNVGPPDTPDDAMHGRIRTTAAEKVSTKCYWKGDMYRMELSGTMREAALFGENLTLSRTITTKMDSPYLRVRDEIENQGFEASPLMMLYHINIGYPLLDENAVYHVPSYHIEARDAASQPGIAKWNEFQAPDDHFSEQVFYHRLCSDEDGFTLIALVNRSKNLAVYLRYNVEQLPILVQWKSMQSGDYVLGIEPANCVPEGRARSQQRGCLKTIQPFEKCAFQWQLGFAEGYGIDEIIGEIDDLRKNGNRT